ncbi:hypothetical protein C0Z16_10725 [Paraburkholderia rhynchosiae]|uniref:Uncharacterized protein n=1 Tax=Paraburkholderia rhynchosiae TaxID=487049 RepID=A0ABX4V704_9BURK|nr:hypothetical protein C0Z16_10725 [Paraburkholderia rhynchosiae]
MLTYALREAHARQTRSHGINPTADATPRADDERHVCSRKPLPKLSLSGYRQVPAQLAEPFTGWPSHRDVMKLRPHLGTTILFCAIKENPRRKNCRVPPARRAPGAGRHGACMRS